MVEWEFIFVLLFSYVYVFMSFGVATSLGREAIDDRDLFLGQAIPLICLIFAIAGWRIGLGNTHLSKQINTKRINTYKGIFPFIVGLALIVIGTVGAYRTSVSVLREKEQMTAEVSAYIYLIFYLGYAGMILCLHFLYSRRIKYLSLKWLIFGGLAFLFMLPYFIHHRRGPLYAYFIILVFSKLLLQRKKPKPLVLLGSFFFMGFILLWFLQIRSYVTRGDSWTNSLSLESFHDAIFSRSSNLYDNEFLNNCHLIGVVWDNKICNYGTGYLYLPLNIVPRQLWKNKPDLGTGILVPKRDVYPLIKAKYGIVMLGFGASAATVADAFLEFKYLTPVFFFGLAYIIGRVYRRYLIRADEISFVVYIGSLACTLWFVLQQFSQLFVPYCFFVIPGVLVIFIAKKVFPSVKYLQTMNRSDPRSLESCK